MTGKDYERLAAALLQARTKVVQVEGDDADLICAGLDYAVDYLCETLAHDNPRFDKEKFTRAAGVHK